MKIRTKKQYTISTIMFDSLKEAEEQINEWLEDRILREGTKVFEIIEIYVPKMKLVKLK